MNILAPSTALILALIASLIIPLVSQLVAKAHWSDQAVGLVTMVLAAVNGFVTEWAQAPNLNHYDWKTAAGIAIFSLIVAIATHYGVWKDGSLARKLRAIGSGAAPAPAAAA